MADRKKTPDILGAVLGGEPEASLPVSQQDSKPAKRQAGKTARQQTAKVVDRANSKPVSQSASKPVKATFYLSPETLDLLEDGVHQLRKLSGHKERSRLTKSALVEEALRTTLRELEKDGPASQLASILVRQKDKP